MNSKFVIIIMMAVWVSLSSLAGNCQTTVSGFGNNSAQHIGAWKLVSYKYSPTGNFVNVPKGDRHIKLISETHFMWAQSDTATMKVSEMAGGAYTLKGNTYTESIDYGIGMNSYVGRRQTFTLLVEGDMLFLSGMLSDGYHVEEVWKRIK
jgi:hypothetical protein